MYPGSVAFSDAVAAHAKDGKVFTDADARRWILRSYKLEELARRYIYVKRTTEIRRVPFDVRVEFGMRNVFLGLRRTCASGRVHVEHDAERGEWRPGTAASAVARRALHGKPRCSTPPAADAARAREPMDHNQEEKKCPDDIT